MADGLPVAEDGRASQTFCFDQLQIDLIAPTAALVAQIGAFWCESFFLGPCEAGACEGLTTVSIEFRLTNLPSPPIPKVAPIYRAIDLTVWKIAAGFLLVSGISWLALYPAEQRAVGILDPTFWAGRPQDQRDFFLLPLLIFGHRHHYYGLHANALTDGRRDYLVIGPSGSGKSTLTVQLLAHGWRCGGDDLIVLRAIDVVTPLDVAHEPVQALALRRDFALSAKTLAYCSPQVAAPTTALCAGGAKAIVAASTLARAALQSEFRPTCLLFATIVDREQSTLVPLAVAAALVTLAQQSAGIMTDRAIGQAQLDLLAPLCRQAARYRLLLGRDLFAQPRRVAALLQGAQ